MIIDCHTCGFRFDPMGGGPSHLCRDEVQRLKLQIRDMQEIVNAAMNENMPRIRAATKVYQDRQRSLKEAK